MLWNFSEQQLEALINIQAVGFGSLNETVYYCTGTVCNEWEYLLKSDLINVKDFSCNKIASNIGRGMLWLILKELLKRAL